MRVNIENDDGSLDVVSVTDEAAAAVRFSFNPSGLSRVNRLKSLAAAFITEARAAGVEANAAREAAVAITNMQTASMWAVLAATTPPQT